VYNITQSLDSREPVLRLFYREVTKVAVDGRSSEIKSLEPRLPARCSGCEVRASFSQRIA